MLSGSVSRAKGQRSNKSIYILILTVTSGPSHWSIFSTNQNWRPFFSLIVHLNNRIPWANLHTILPSTKTLLASPTLALTGSENSVNNASNGNSGKRVNPSSSWFSWVMLMGLCRLLMTHTTYDNHPWRRIGKTV